MASTSTTATVAFALTPAAVVQDQVRDYSEKSQVAVYKFGTSSLYQDSNDRFDLTAPKIQNFLDRIADRASECSLTVIKVPTSKAEIAKTNPKTKHICLHHGELPLDLIKDYAKTYIGQNTRKAQDDHILLVLLKNSLREIPYLTIKAEAEQFTINDVESGLAMLKVILMNSAIDALVDPDVIRTELANAYQRFRELNFNVNTFNNWVMQKVNQLTQSGTKSTDLRSHLFIAYETSPDEEFVRYISAQRDATRTNQQHHEQWGPWPRRHRELPEATPSIQS